MTALEIELPPSKSIWNRALVINSYSERFEFDVLACTQNSSLGNDIEHLTQSLKDLARGKTVFDAGEGGAPFRFLAMKVSRQPGGYYKIYGSKRLLSRPHQELKALLLQLNTDVLERDTHWELRPRGWQNALHVAIDCKDSTQFASGFLLNTCGLSDPVVLRLSNLNSSQGYLEMTIKMLRASGARIEEESIGGDFVLTVDSSKVLEKKWTPSEVEADWSSASYLIFLGSQLRPVRLRGLFFGGESLQPDSKLQNLLEAMGVEAVADEFGLLISPADNLKGPGLKGLICDCSATPDLFPTLVLFAIFAKSESTLLGIDYTEAKESKRATKMVEILSRLGVRFQRESNSLKIFPGMNPAQFDFDPDQDHRMAMVAGCLQKMGVEIRLKSPEVVNKSFPEFWKIMKRFDSL